MHIIELFILAVGLSMDAFAVAVCAGLGLKRVTFREALTVGLYFGVFQAAMPLIGYLAAALFADKIIAYDHWIVFALLCYLGVRMIVGSLKRDGNIAKDVSLGPAYMLPLAVATSIDALAAGVSFAFLRADIVPAVLLIGATTLVLSAAGVGVGSVFGLRFKSRAELAGGVILILMGLKVLNDHLGVVSF
jgi:putative Mn2+ efflux pump MntP